MYICYTDESGNDGMLIKNGVHQQVTPLYVTTVLYFHQDNWKAQYQNFYGFRRNLKETRGFPVKLEFHTLPFLKNKNPYRDLGLSDKTRLEILLELLKFISTMEFSTVNVVINKSKITIQENKIVEWGFGYAVQRIENAVKKLAPNDKFFIISDRGRIPKMRSIARKIQRINFIPSMFSPTIYRQEVSLLVEDVLEKNSKESYFIQIADMISFIVCQYAQIELGINAIPKRMPVGVNQKYFYDMMKVIKPILNTYASKGNAYGIVYHPT